LKDNSCQSLIDFRLNRISEYLLEKIMDQRERGKILAELGTVHSLLGEPRKAIDHYEKALVIARMIGDKKSEANALGNLGNACYVLGEARKAIEFTKAAYDTFEQIESLYAEQARKKLAERQGDDSHK